MAVENFNAYSKYYDLLYESKNYKDESDYIFSLIDKFQPESRTVLELGCGSGSHAEYLCNRGFTVTGVERSSEMIDLALQKDLKGFFPIQGDISDFELSGSFDIAISLFHVISYLTNNLSLIRCFNLTNKHLKPGGFFIFDIWFTPAVINLSPETRIKRFADEEVEITRIAEASMDIYRNIVDVNYEVQVRHKSSGNLEIIKETHPMRHFSIPEIELLAALTGFELVIAEEFLTTLTPSLNTWGVCFVLKKITID